MKWPRGQSPNPGGFSHGERLFREMEALVMSTVDTAQPMDPEGPPVTVAHVAAYLGVTRSRIHQLDGALKPARAACGCRTYDRGTVLAYARQRELEREALARARSEWMRELRRRMRQ